METMAQNSDGTIRLDKVKWGFTEYFEINKYAYKKNLAIIEKTIGVFGHLREAQTKFREVTGDGCGEA